MTFKLSRLVASKLLTLTVSAVTSTALLAAPAKAVADENEWSPLWLGAEKPTKGETYLPDGLTASMFDLSEDDEAVVEVGDIVRDVAMEDLGGDAAASEESEAAVQQTTASYPPPNFVIRDQSKRTPASVKSKKAPKASKVSRKQAASKSNLQKVTLTKSTRPLPAMNTTSMASEAKARWPQGASEGFEFRVRHKAQVSSMWVMKRQDRFDVVYATNGGSRVNLTIPADQFYALSSAASELRSTTNTTEKCRDSFVQVNVVAANGGRAIASCLEAKGKDADKLRVFGATLSSFVR